MRSLALGLVAVVASCASLPSSSSVPSPANAGVVVSHSAKLQRAPYDQSYAFVPVGAIFDGTTPAEDSSASVSLQQLRTSMRVSLEAVGWAEAALPNARYHIAVLTVQ